MRLSNTPSYGLARVASWLVEKWLFFFFFKLLALHFTWRSSGFHYDKKASYLGVIKFNKLLFSFNKKIIPLGGINSDNLNNLKLINSEGFSLLSEIKKKPANIINRLF